MTGFFCSSLNAQQMPVVIQQLSFLPNDDDDPYNDHPLSGGNSSIYALVYNNGQTTIYFSDLMAATVNVVQDGEVIGTWQKAFNCSELNVLIPVCNTCTIYVYFANGSVYSAEYMSNID